MDYCNPKFSEQNRDGSEEIPTVSSFFKNNII